jgi:hypothetical protein
MKTCCEVTGVDCNQGRSCPVRQACELPQYDPEGELDDGNVFVPLVWLLVALSAFFVGAFVIGAAWAVWPVLASVL